jgi:melibiose permease/lactose/raffinose/galactose permease
MLATAFLMVFYPAISKKFHRKPLVKMMAVISTFGYLVMLAAGLAMESSMMKFWIITIGFMLANFGQYGLYLILMISIINTVEYNEYTRGNRDEAIITSMRPFLTKLSSSLVIVIATISYMLFNVTDYTNQISSLENAAQQGKIDAATRSSEIANVIAQVGHNMIGVEEQVADAFCLRHVFHNLCAGQHDRLVIHADIVHGAIDDLRQGFADRIAEEIAHADNFFIFR